MFHNHRIFDELVGQAAGAVNAEETRIPLVREVLVCKHDAVTVLMSAFSCDKEHLTCET